ncbi:MAG: hypothetical protein HC895_21730, partial [Leptolyngbyaceae cyanobacterium SM1_3_5]|nr:hypothetical protein [Leptolyngbyaceae cyanobacterium SM1_3_5]
MLRPYRGNPPDRSKLAAIDRGAFAFEVFADRFGGGFDVMDGDGAL